jgi:hypothetical protein
MGQTALRFSSFRRHANRVAGKPLEGRRHIFDAGMLVPISYGFGGVAADCVTYPLLDPRTLRTSTERVPPRVIRLDVLVCDSEPPYPRR